MVSIIIPVYNSGKYLSRCLDSLLLQTYNDLELLCVNDGSVDNSLEILKEYAARDSRIRVYSKQNEGKGAASARNLGLSHAAGKYVMFLDSDDFFEPDMVKEMTAKAERHDADLVICGADRYDQKTQRSMGKYPHIHLEYAPDEDSFSWKDCPDRVFQIGDILAWNKLYKRELLKANHLYFEPVPITDDRLIPILSTVLAQRICVVKKCFVHYRVNTGTSQVDSLAKHPEAAYASINSIVRRMRDAEVYEQVKRSYLNTEIPWMRECFDRMKDIETLRFLHSKYTQEVFPMLGATSLPENYFYDSRVEAWYRLITTKSLEEILFDVSQAYGAGWTTAILRFQVPLSETEQGSRVVLLGKNLIARYWYAQLLLSGYCEVVFWAETEDEIPNTLSYDCILRA